MTQPPSGPNPLDPAFLQQLLTAQLGGLAGVLLPQIPKSLIPQIVPGMVKEQAHLGETLIPAILSPTKDQPSFTIRIYKTKNGQPGGPPVPETVRELSVHKSLSARVGEDDAHEHALYTAMLIGFAMEPAYRGLLRLMGYHYEFISYKQAPAPKLQLLKR